MSSLSFLTSLCFFDANLRILDKTAELQRSFFPLASREKFCRKKKAAYICSAQSPDGGIGRRTGLKIQRPQGCAGSTPAPGTAFSDLAIFLARSFCFPASYNLPPTHPEQFRQPTFSLHARTKAARIRYSYCPSSIRPDTKKPAAFSGRRLKSTVEQSTITGNPDSQGSG